MFLIICKDSLSFKWTFLVREKDERFTLDTIINPGESHMIIEFLKNADLVEGFVLKTMKSYKIHDLIYPLDKIDSLEYGMYSDSNILLQKNGNHYDNIQRITKTTQSDYFKSKKTHTLTKISLYCLKKTI